MRYFCLACDFDGTLAHDGRVTASTLASLRRVRQSGRKLALVTGRTLADLMRVFPQVNVFDCVVAENGALVYAPAGHAERVLAAPPPQQFLEVLTRRAVPFSLGRSILATWHPHQTTVLEVIHEMGLDLHVVFNKGAVMVLPSSVDKASGLHVALEELSLSAHNVAGIGDAENDYAFLSLCECGVAVANALPELKKRVDYVTSGDHGAGTEELIESLLANDLEELEPRLARHRILLGRTASGASYTLEPHGSRLLVAGPPSSGKTNTVATLLEQLHEKEYQICLVDPEGHYDESEHFVKLGGPNRIPATSEILEVLDRPKSSLSINLLAIPAPDRPSYLLATLPRIQHLRSRTGRPHWLVIDESQQLLPAGLDSVELTAAMELSSVALITVHPGLLHAALLAALNGAIYTGADPAALAMELNRATRLHWDMSKWPKGATPEGTVVVWPFAGRPEIVTVEPDSGGTRQV